MEMEVDVRLSTKGVSFFYIPPSSCLELKLRRSLAIFSSLCSGNKCIQVHTKPDAPYSNKMAHNRNIVLIVFPSYVPCIEPALNLFDISQPSNFENIATNVAVAFLSPSHNAALWIQNVGTLTLSLVLVRFEEKRAPCDCRGYSNFMLWVAANSKEFVNQK